MLIFMALPQGCEAWFLKKYPKGSGQSLPNAQRIIRFKQSARSWNTTFSIFLKQYDLIQSITDPCILYSTSSPCLILTLWVDDGITICKDKSLLNKMITHLKTKFEVTVGDADVYVGLHITRHLAHKRLHIDQQR